jgi:hypothetical protein
MMDHDEIVDLLHRTFRAGLLRRLPKKQAHADVFMALSVIALDPETFFDETEINLHLSAFLNGIASQDGFSDYVSFRRYLVDLGFLRRATDGAIYRLCPERIAEVLPPTATDIDPTEIYNSVELEKLARREKFGQQN